MTTRVRYYSGSSDIHHERTHASPEFGFIHGSTPSRLACITSDLPLAAAVTWPRPRATGLIHGSLFVNRSRSIEHRDGCSLHLYVCTHAKNKACMYAAAAVCGHVVNSSSTNSVHDRGLALYAQRGTNFPRHDHGACYYSLFPINLI